LFALSITGLILLFRQKYHRDRRRAVLEEQAKLVQKENEFSAQARQSAEEIIALKNEKLKSEINHKNKELAGSAMHLINKNEFITKLKNQIDNLIASSSSTTSSELKKIVKEIERNISSDDDWQQFEIHFDKVHGDFSRRLKAAYPQLTHQDMKLCAFLKLNMSTKEIANMLNITIRGVELSRYRLRKKLELDRSQNLTDFILGF
jgi:DNA-binding CsgD family transcriptional regulator